MGNFGRRSRTAGMIVQSFVFQHEVCRFFTTEAGSMFVPPESVVCGKSLRANRRLSGGVKPDWFIEGMRVEVVSKGTDQRQEEEWSRLAFGFSFFMHFKNIFDIYP